MLCIVQGSENPYKGRKTTLGGCLFAPVESPSAPLFHVSKMAVLAPVSFRQGKVLEETGLSLSSVAIDSKNIVILCGKTIKMSQ